MINTSSFSEKKMRKRRLFSFLYSIIITSIGVITYILLRSVVGFPNIFSSSLSIIGELDRYKYSFFCLGISPFINANIIVSLILFFLQKKEIDPINLKNIRAYLYRIFLIITCLIGGALSFINPITESVRGNGKLKGFLTIFLFFIVLLVIYCCFLDLSILFFNKFGVCDIFNVLFIFSIVEDFKIILNFFGIALSLILAFLWFFFTNCKWGVPVNSNTIVNIDDKENKFWKEFNLEFKFNFSSFHLYNLKLLLTWIFSFIAVIVNWKKGSGMWGLWTEFATVVKQSELGFSALELIDPFCRLNASPAPFSLAMLRLLFGTTQMPTNLESEALTDTSDRESKIISGINSFKLIIVVLNLFFYISTKWLVVYYQRKLIDLRASEIAKGLRSRGIYIDGVRPGSPTSKLIDKNLSKMVNIWCAAQLIGNIIFDNFIFFVFKDSISFINWLNLINTEREILQQIRTKKRYTFNSC